MKKISFALLWVLILALVFTLSSCFLFQPDSDDSEMNPPNGEGEGSGDGEGEGEEDGGETPEPEPDIPNINFSGISFPAKTVTYDGTAHSIEIEGSINNIYVTVKYEGNEVVNAGTHTVTAKFYYKDIYLEGKDMTSTLTIERAKYDLYGIGFGDVTVIYDGKPHSTTIKAELPKGVRVQYSGNAVTEIGEHTVTANFICDTTNYMPIEPMTAKVKIIDGPATLGGLSFADTICEYDGLDHSVVLSGKLSGASATYSTTAQKNAGEYECVATITHSGGSLEMRAMLTILPRKVDAVAEDLTVKYDGEKHSIELKTGEGDIIPGFNVIEIGNDTLAIGTHEVIFRFMIDEGKRGNFIFVPEIKRTLTILPPESFSDDGFLYEWGSDGYTITGYQGDATHLIIPAKIGGANGSRVSGIASGAFKGNKTIEYVYIPDDISTIGAGAFSGCEALSEVTIPKRLTALGSLAFEDTAIRSAVLPDSLKAIGQGAFRGCDKIESITLPFIGGSHNTSNKYLGYIFGASYYVGNKQYLPESLKRVVISDKCTTIHAYSFYGAEYIEEVVIGAGVTEIGVSAFQDCASLKYLYIPSGVVDIPASANYYNSPVYGCTSLTIGAAASARLDGWGKRWCTLSEEEAVPVMFGLTYLEYMTAMQKLVF